MLSLENEVGPYFYNKRKQSKMKAIIVKEKGSDPVYVTDYKETIIESPLEVLLKVKAVSIKNLDRAIASGQHYSVANKPFVPFVVGTDGIGELSDGSLVYGFGLNGMLSDYAVVPQDRLVPLPKGIDLALAAALPNALLGSVMAMLVRGNLKKGGVVLIHGATGVTGQIAIQMARHYGASTIIATGRNKESLNQLQALGVDHIISLVENPDQFIQSISQIHKQTPIDLVIDYIWGESAFAILTALKGKGSYQHKTKFVNVGAMSGDRMEISSSILRGTDIHLLGSGIGSWTDVEMQRFFKELLPEAFTLAAKGKLKLQTVCHSWKNIEQVWNTSLFSGERLVFIID